MIEKFSELSKLKNLRRKVDSYEQENERWKKKQQLLQKTCMDLNTFFATIVVSFSIVRFPAHKSQLYVSNLLFPTEPI